MAYAGSSTQTTLAASRICLLLDPSTIDYRPPSGGIDTIIFPQSSLTLPKRNFSNVKLLSFVIENEYYNIVDDQPYGLKNNEITLDGNPITIPPGNYNAENFLTTIIALFNLAGPGVFTGVYDSITMMFTISSTVPFQLDFGPFSPFLEMGYALGFSTGIVASTTSTQPLNLSGPPNILINIQEIMTSSLVYYSGSPYHFAIPLTLAFPSLSQTTWLQAGKIDCALTGFNQLYNLTVRLWYTRAGIIWPYVSWPGTSYQLMLEFS